MVRSKWKGMYLGKRDFLKKNGLIYDRAVSILKMHIGRVVHVYNGKKKIRINIEEGMEKHKFGEFAITRRMGKTIHTINKKRNIKKKKK
jgi:ribosomal protein S19